MAAQLKTITTRSGRFLGPDVVRERVENEEVVDEEIEMEVSDMFRQLKINLPFIEAIQHMPKYAKFLKDLLKRKDWLGEVSSIPLSEDCSEVVLIRVLEKLSDSGVFTIPCMFRSNMISQALEDLGASINLMPYSLHENSKFSELTPTRMSFSLADRSIKYPRGIIQNLLVKVDQFVFPVDFLVLDMEADERVPIILGHPFLRTAKALIDVYDGRVTLRVSDENVTYDITKSMNHPGDHDDFSGPCHSICGVDFVEMDVDEKLKEEVVDDVSGLAEIMEVNEVICEKDVEKPALLELKVLPSHLEYAYLEEGSNLPVIVVES
ncbi:uncharacterized protein LOC143635610 [Bidens hawaiensis]|uniref:uncharacterized protein LOC143635610 n=1 Tax=Bidens hawaiensis TaxID=980011 RepID=UPI004049323D